MNQEALGDTWATRQRNTLKEERRLRKAVSRGRISPGEACARAEGTRAYWEARLHGAIASGRTGELLICWLSAGHARTLSKYLTLASDGQDPEQAEAQSGHQQSIEVMGLYLEALNDPKAPVEVVERLEGELAELWGIPAPAGINA